jgi:hypothetical protein
MPRFRQLGGATVVTPPLAAVEEVFDAGRGCHHDAEYHRDRAPDRSEVQSDQRGHSRSEDQRRDSQRVIDPEVRICAVLEPLEVIEVAARQVVSDLSFEFERGDGAL